MSKKKLQRLLKSLPASKFLIVEGFPGFAMHKIGIEPENGYLTLLVSGRNDKNLNFSPGGGKYLTISYDKSCSIKTKSSGLQKNQRFTILTLKSNDESIRAYFLDLCDIFVKRIGKAPKLQEVKRQYEILESIFAKLSKNSSKDVLGLWGELFIINRSSRPDLLIAAWHKSPKDKFDFNDGVNRMDVKTTTMGRRRHHFDFYQLKEFGNGSTSVASVLTMAVDTGVSIPDLIEQIKQKVDSRSFELLLSKTFEVIGDQISELGDSRYDFSLAESELRWFSVADIPKPGLVPNEVIQISILVDLENVSPMANKIW